MWRICLCPMVQAILRWVFPLAAMFVLGPLAWMMTGTLRARDGSADASLLVCVSPMMGVGIGVGVMLIALVVGMLGARLIGATRGLLCAGLVLVWAAAGTGRVDEILGQTGGGGTLWMLSAEGLMLTVIGAGIAWLILRTPLKPLGGLAATSNEQHEADVGGMTMWDSSVPMALGAAILGAAVVGWIVAFDAQKGQTIGAAVLAGVGAAVVARLVSQTASPAVFIAGVALLGVAGPAAATLVHGSGLGPTRAAINGSLLALARPLPLDWVAGAMLGVPMGLSWAGSLIQKHEPKGK